MCHDRSRSRERQDKPQGATNSSGLDAQGQAIVAALNASLGTKIDAVDGKLSSLSAKVDDIDGKVKHMDKKVDAVSERVDKQDERIAKLESALESGPNKGHIQSDFVPKSKRKLIVIGAFGDSSKESVETTMAGIIAEVEPRPKIYVKGKLIDVARIEFDCPDTMWAFLKKHKGKKFSHNGKDLWHRVHQTVDEQNIGKRTSKAVSMVREHVKNGMSIDDEKAKQIIDGDWDLGLVFYRPDSGPVVRLYDRAKDETTLRVHKDAASSAINFDFKAKLSDINAAA